MKENNYSVYQHTGPTGLIYIGITKQEPEVRWKNGRGYINNARFMNAINKYGWDSFEHKIIDSGLCKEEAEKKEIELISFFDSTNPERGYNIALGGFTNIPTDETKKKIQNKIRDNWNNPKMRKKMSDSMKGVKRSETAKRNISKAQKERFSDPEQRRLAGKRQKGKKRSEEAKRKTSESLLRFYSDDANRKRIQEIRAKVRNRAVPIICVDNGERFDSILDASKKYNIAHQNIIKVCRGQRAHAGGYVWQYAED